jgi:hypothetical protein
MPTNGPQLLANGNIAPCRFVKIDTGAGTDDYAHVIGVSGQGTNQPPLSDLISTQFHAQAGDPIRVHPDGDVCLLEIGAAVTQDQRLKADVNGAGVPIATSGAALQQIGAIALESSTVVGSRIRVQVKIYSEVSPT